MQQERDWTKGTVAGLVGIILTPLGFAALYHRAYGRGGVLAVAGTFLLLSAFAHMGFKIKNPALSRIAGVYGFAVSVAVIAVLLLAAVAVTAQTGVWAYAKLIENVQEHFWADLFILAVVCWLLISRQRGNPKP